MAVDNSRSLERGNSYSRGQFYVRAAGGDLAALEGYLANGVNIDGKDEDGLALIHYAACHGNIPLICKLREYGADMNLLDDGAPPWKPIHYAIFHRKHEAEQVLRILGAEVPLPILNRVSLERSRNLRNEKGIEVRPTKRAWIPSVNLGVDHQETCEAEKARSIR